MKKIIFGILVSFILGLGFTSCTQCVSRSFGGDMTIKLEPGEKLIEATWKNNNIWYLTEPMESDYVPKVKIFKESSMGGVFEESVTFIETR